MYALGWFMDAAASAREERAWERALRSYESALRQVTTEGEPRVSAEILRGIGNVHYTRGDFEAARDVFLASLCIAEANGSTDLVVAALNCLAVVEQYAGGAREAEEYYLRARALADALGDARRAAMIEQNLGTLASMRGEPEEALLRYESARERLEAMGDERGAARILQNMGMAHVDMGTWAAAEHCFAEAARRAAELGDTETLALVEINRTKLHLRRGGYEEARECCDRALDLFGEVEAKAGIAEACKFSGVIYRETGRLQVAEAELELAASLARLCGDRLLEAEVERERGVLHLGSGRRPAARTALARAHSLFSELRATREAADVERRLAALDAN